jgi:hypothetical protein
MGSPNMLDTESRLLEREDTNNRTARPAITLVAYRSGDAYELERREGPVEPVAIALVDGARVARSGCGRLLVYGRHAVYGVELRTAMALGWCRIVEC